MTNTVRTKVAKTAKSELRFFLFVILLFLLPQLVSARNEDLQTETLTASTITSDPDALVITSPGGTTQALALSPELPIEMEPVQLMNQLLTQLSTKPSTEIHPTPFMGTAANNILDWLENFDRIAAHNVWNDQKQLHVIPVYLKDTALNFYYSLPEQTKLISTF